MMADDEQCPWKPTAQNLRRWKLLQTSNAFLQDAQDRGSLSCHYCKKGPLCVYRWEMCVWGGGARVSARRVFACRIDSLISALIHE